LNPTKKCLVLEDALTAVVVRVVVDVLTPPVLRFSPISHSAWVRGTFLLRFAPFLCGLGEETVGGGFNPFHRWLRVFKAMA
jgi:hypothetical protein